MGIFWALALIVALIYAILLLRADNHAKAASWRCSHSSSHGTHRGSPRAALPIVGLIGRWRNYAIDLGAQRRIDAPTLAPMVVPIKIAICFGLFLALAEGTECVESIFGPTMLARFVTIAVLGLKVIMQSTPFSPAFSPHYGRSLP